MTTEQPKLITPDDYPDFIGIVRGPNLRSAFIAANEMLDEPGKRAVVWIPDQYQHSVMPPNFRDGERPAFPAPDDSRIQARGTYIVLHKPTPPNVVHNDAIPHIDGIHQLDNGIWLSEPPCQRVCLLTNWGRKKQSGTVLYSAIPTTDLIDDQGNIRDDKHGELGQAYQAAAGCALVMRIGGHPKDMAFHRAHVLDMADGPDVGRIINRITYDWMPSHAHA